ncbi:MAG TPA: DUF1326 domain-containing protein [Candidatus Acidoferrales bacterium]|nr:DUF1326 domain-containing protein [Candidatus Acidoferrales bacterium]
MRRIFRLIAAIVLVLCSVPLLHPQKGPVSPAAEDFDLEGTALFQCQCAAHSCPCQKNGAPSHGTCEAADFAHINSGRYGKLRLDGLNLVAVGNLVDAHQDRLYAVLYVDQIATSAQRQALTIIMQFMYGAYETSLLRFSEVKAVPMDFRESGDKTSYIITIPGILEEKTLLKHDPSGKPVSNETAMDTWSNTEHYAENQIFAYHDGGLHRNWDHSGGYANIKYFHVTKKMYDNKELLGQFGDLSGHWTPEQLEIIHKQHLKEK